MDKEEKNNTKPVPKKGTPSEEWAKYMKATVKNNKTKFTDEELKKRMKNFVKFNSERQKTKK